MEYPQTPRKIILRFLQYYYDLSTTAHTLETIRITFPYGIKTQIAGAEQNLRLFHWESGEWEDVKAVSVIEEKEVAWVGFYTGIFEIRMPKI